MVAAPTRPKISLVGLALVAALVLVCGGLASQAASAQLAVIGFQEESDPLALIDANASALTTVGVDGVNLTATGASVTTPDHAALAQLARAHAQHLKAVLLIGNFDESIEDFNEATAYGLLGNPQHITAVASRVTSSIASGGWDGVSVDLESLLARDSAGLVEFLQALRAELPAQDSVNIDVTNYTGASQYRAAGYDLADIGASADEVTLMAYDQHGPWEKRPGPVGSLSWTRAGLAVVLRSIPAAKIDLGAAGYGYAWGPHGGVQLSDGEARERVTRDHARAKFKASVGEWTAHLADGTTIWWSDARSYQLRASLAAADHLHGLAVWSLGLSDPLAPLS